MQSPPTPPSPFEDLFGPTLTTSKGESPTAEVLAGKKAVALYFSAHWCPPCKGFTPQLAKWYTNDLQGKDLEIVFVSGDRDEAAFTEYFAEMPWVSLPFADRDRESALSKKFKVSGIPSVVILDGVTGELITTDGKAAISGDPTGEEMPWRPKSLDELLNGALISKPGGEPTDAKTFLAGKVFAFYFSAHWCPPCKGFTPKLASWYTKDLHAKGLEVVFVSSDRDEGAFTEYAAEMPWHALEFADRKRKEQLSTRFGVSGIPSVVIIDADGSVISKDGRAAISADPAGEDFPWHPKPVKNLKGGPGNINETPTVLAFCETSDAATQAAVVEAMTPAGARFLAEAKATKEDPTIEFIVVTSSEGLSSRLRSMFKMAKLPPLAHEHDLELSDRSSGWGCDGCGKSGAEERFRCTAGCDFDYCGECHAAAGKSADAQAVKLVMCDIPDNGGYYEGPAFEGAVTSADVEKFLADYKSKALTRSQLE